MSPFYNPAYLRGLSVTRIRVDGDGVIIEAEGYDGSLRKWAYRYDRRLLNVDWIWQ